MPTIFVSAHRIGQRIQGKDAADPITVEFEDGRVEHASDVLIDGPSRLTYRPDAPNLHGARCWLTTGARVVLGSDEESPV